MRNKDTILLENAYSKIHDDSLNLPELGSHIKLSNLGNDKIAEFVKKAIREIYKHTSNPIRQGMKLSSSEAMQNRGIELAIEALLDAYWSSSSSQEDDDGDDHYPVPNYLEKQDRIAQDNYEGTRD